MTPCERARQGLQDRVDGLGTPHERSALDIHLAHCAACRTELASLLALTASLEALPEADVPADFAGRVMADLPEMLPAAAGPGHVLRWGIGVAALLSGFVATVAMLLHAGGPEAAQQTLQPLGASFQLSGILLAQVAAGLAVGLNAMSQTLHASGFDSPIVVIVLFAAANAALLGLLAKLRPGDEKGVGSL